MRPVKLLLSLLLATPILAAARAPLSPDLSSLSSVPLHSAPAAAVAKALSRVDSKSQPLHYGVNTALTLGLQSGIWDEPEAGLARWRLRVGSAGAVGVALHFSRFDLPAEAALWIYDEAGRVVQGPYERRDRNTSGGLWTALVPQSTAVVELRVPAAARDAVQLQLAQVQHAFLDISKSDVMADAKSGSCNRDVVCSDGDGWRDEIRSVARITIGAPAILCTGNLVNNVAQGYAPLFLTANHCEIDKQSVADSVTVYWNYQTSLCGGVPNGSLAQNQTGAALLAGDVGTDFTLLQLNRLPLFDYHPYYAGWDASGAIPQSGVSVHHPAGDEKRISTFSSPAVSGKVCIENSGPTCTREVQSWQVTWARGTTEGGSSGGGLWNQDHRLVGTLSGGDASCAAPDASDYFARLAAAYTANTARSGQLKAWLDPRSSGALSVAGLDSVPIFNTSDDARTVVQGSTANSLDVLTNDSSNLSPVTITDVGARSAGGNVSISADRQRLIYTPVSGFSGTETFTYTAMGSSAAGEKRTGMATVTMTVSPTSTPDSGGGGGGALGLGTLALLALAAAARRRGAQA